MLPDRSVLIGQRLVENAKIQKFKCDILSNFQTLFSFMIKAGRINKLLLFVGEKVIFANVFLFCDVSRSRGY